ncbi:uncharacterized protein LOC112139653, partial [Oryzias melastigma]|uniref:uncharacterized protein LOC112139653 n=1 Tax=Oryzias melastigma TaxID=30732 RepID=UPI000CF83B6F
MPLSKKAKAKKAFWNRIKSDLHAETGEAAASSCPESTQQTSMSAEVPAQTSYCPGEGPKPPKVFCDELHAKGESSKMPSLSVQKVTTDVTKSGADHGAEGCSRADPDMNPQPSVTVVRATTSQASNRFGKNANKQCVANSLMFLSFLFEDENITTSDLDSVLDKGNEVYIQAKQRYPNSNPFLATDELPHEVSARRCDYQVDRSQLPINGKFGGTQHYPSLEEQLNRLTADVQYAIVIMASLGFAVFRTRSGRYDYFDPHARCVQGLPVGGAPSAGGTSIMLTFTSLRDMIDRISISFAIMGISPKTDYELQPVMFHSMNRGILRNLMAQTSMNKQNQTHDAANLSKSGSEHISAQPLIEEHATLSKNSSVNRSAHVINSEPISENLSAPVVTSDRQEKVQFTENQNHHEPPTLTHNSVPPSTSDTHTVSAFSTSTLQGISCKLTKLSKHSRKKMQRRLMKSVKTPQRKENQKQKERQKYASDESYQASKKSYSRERYHSNTDTWLKKVLSNTKWYKDHAELVKEKNKAYSRKSYHANKSFREKHKFHMKQYVSKLYSHDKEF